MLRKIRQVRCGKFLCFRDVASSTQDIKEVEPIFRDGSYWRQWEGLGMRHGCNKHPPPPSKSYYLAEHGRPLMHYTKSQPVEIVGSGK